MRIPEAGSPLQGFDDFIRATMRDWKVPGLAIAIIKNGEVIFSQGFGLRDVVHDLKMTPQTRFAIGSCTKAFTTMVMGMLADEGKLEWDAPVRKYLPTFRMYDAFATGRMTPRDLVTHRSGLPSHDFVWYRSSRTRQELFDRLQYLEPSKDFRGAFQYQNLMYMAAGYLVGQIAGQSWEDVVQQRLFDRLGMTSSNFSVDLSQQGDDYALPYQEEKGEVKEESESDRVPDTHPSHPLNAYTGNFENPGYGLLSVESADEQLKGTFNSTTFPLKHHHYDIFRLDSKWLNLSTRMSFSTNLKGDIESLAVQLEPEVKAIVFQRVPG